MASKTRKDENVLTRLADEMRGRCGKTFIPDDGGTPFVCDIKGRHVVHSDSVDGTSGVPAPGGGLFSKKGR